jgi:hypothetical protein
MAPAARTRTRTRDGYLILGESYILPGQERTRRWCRRGIALGAPVFFATILYVSVKYGRPKGILGLPQARFISWDVMPFEVRVLLFVAIASWALFFFSMVRLVLLQRTVADQLVSDLAEDD